MRLALLALSVLAALAARADTPIATTLYKEGDGLIEGNLLADTVKSVTVADGTATVVQRDATAAESTITFTVGAGGGGAAPAEWAKASADQPSVNGQVLLRDLDGTIGWNTIGGASIADDSVSARKIVADTITDTELADSVADRLLPGGGTTGQVLAKSSANAYDAGWVTPATGSGSGLSQAQVDARIVAGVLAEARAGNTSRWGKAKLPSDAVYTATQRFSAADETKLDSVEAGATADQTAAEVVSLIEGLSGAARLDANALRNLPSGGSGASAFTGLSDTPASYTGEGGKAVVVNSGATALEFQTLPQGNVQADWSQSDANNQAFVRNKPTNLATLDASGRLDREVLPVALDDFLDALRRIAGWTDEGNNAATDIFVSNRFASVANPSNVDTSSAEWRSSVQQGIRQTNVFVQIRVPLAVVVDRLVRLEITNSNDTFQATYLGTTWNSVTDDQYRSYTVRVADIPVGATFRVQRYSPSQIDAPLIGIEKWAEIYDGGPPVPGDLVIPASRTAAEVNHPPVSQTEIDAQSAVGSKSWTLQDIVRLLRLYLPANAAADEDKVLTAGATAGSASWERVKRLALTTLMDGAGTGQAITQSSQDRRQTLQGFAPSFDLDDNSTGIVEVVATVTLGSRATNSLGFDETLTPSARATFTGYAFASDLLAAPDYRTSASNGAQIGNAATIFEGAGTVLGVYEFWLGHDSNNRLGWYLDYDGRSSNRTWNAAVHIEAAFFHSDARRPRSFIVTANNTSAVTLTTGGTPDVYTGYSTIVTAPAITAAQAGNVEVSVKIEAEVSTSTSGGGERVVTRYKLVRTRDSVDEDLDTQRWYGPRNVSNIDSATGNDRLQFPTEARTGDVFSVQAQVASQVAARAVEFGAANRIQITPVGG